ncbi:GTPase HflX [Acidianus sulfidivorans JP7]|uniref:GTPase HflX n=1 Tax=Acidianus sulfidivorans JP7 TaxID=619593 RepID=A0A2U9IMK6_9CREN|nr:GTPase HflX [Acidianus sulfidivorans]AWR97252.1 GTPase HflX [Acidianus sulfidivorans JP7]
MKAILFVSDDFRDEAEILAETAGYEISAIYKLPKRPNPKYYIQENRVSEISSSKDVDAIIIFDLLKPRYFINLNKALKNVKILDKLLLLLEIFALHAGSKEAQLQIELAKLKYELPIIKDVYKKHKISEQQGLLGAGVYGVESILRLYHRKISRITKELEQLKRIRELQIQDREKEGYPTIAITGYTNSGKTSIFNALTGLKQKVDSSMFTTTAPKRSRIIFNNSKILLIDTVGFITGIPPQIIEAFFVTLSEIKYADIILLLVDISLEDTLLLEMIKSSFNILRELGISGKPILIAANKVDKLKKEDIGSKLDLIYKTSNELYSPIVDVIPTSAKTMYNIENLKVKIAEIVSEYYHVKKYNSN